MEQSELWWKHPVRMIQTNLQVRDTPLMIPAKIAREIADMGANALVFNVGGIYAWYRSVVRYHHVNEYLPEDFDLIDEMIKECHKNGVRFVARFDFSKTDDYVYQEQPQWFVRDAENRPKIVGMERLGVWSRLVTTCINAGYRNEGVAVPVTEEVLGRYAIDGIFFNAPNYEFCRCGVCREKYRKLYGEELPTAAKDLRTGFASTCMKDNIDRIYKTAKRMSPDIPVILYYGFYKGNDLNDRLTTADMLCTEPQDVLSRGHHHIPQFWRPALSIKVGRSAITDPAPFGIIHSCPGMDWRHTGLPPAEYDFWLSQIPANGGMIWHSLTGFGDTITDKRIIDSVTKVNNNIKKIETHMQYAESAAETVLLWNGETSAEGWIEGLVNTQTQFDVLDTYQLTAARLAGYRLVIVPGDYPYDAANVALLADYVKDGGRLIVEGSPDGAVLTGADSGAGAGPTAAADTLLELLGIGRGYSDSEYLYASYLRFEDGAGNPLAAGAFERTPLIAHRGVVTYCRPLPGARVLATLVPPFAPMDAVGAPPERASILTPRTDIPLCILNAYGKGAVMYLPFRPGELVVEFKLGEHYRLMKNVVDTLLGGSAAFSMEPVNGLQAVAYRKGDTRLVHFVNGIGQRPLASATPYHDLRFSVALDVGKTCKSVRSVIADADVEWSVSGGDADGGADRARVHCRLARLDVWDMIEIVQE